MDEIDSILADDLQSGDTIRNTDGVFVTLVKVETDGDLILAYGEDDPDWPYAFQWDEQVTLYGH